MVYRSAGLRHIRYFPILVFPGIIVYLGLSHHEADLELGWLGRVRAVFKVVNQSELWRSRQLGIMEESGRGKLEFPFVAGGAARHALILHREA